MNSYTRFKLRYTGSVSDALSLELSLRAATSIGYKCNHFHKHQKQ